MGLRERTSPGARVSFDAAHRTDGAVQTQPPTIKKNTLVRRTHAHTQTQTHTHAQERWKGGTERTEFCGGGGEEVALDGDCQNR